MWSELLIAILSGLLGASASAYFRRRSDKKTAGEQLLFKVYMLLLELNEFHFRVVSREIRGEKPNPEVISKFDDLRWRIADLLRQVDDLPEMDDLLRAMFSLAFATENVRATELKRIVTALGSRVTPRYGQAMKQVSEENEALMAQDLNEFFRRQSKIQSP